MKVKVISIVNVFFLCLLVSCSKPKQQIGAENAIRNYDTLKSQGIVYCDTLVGHQKIKIELRNDSLYFVMKNKTIVEKFNKPSFYPDKNIKCIYSIRNKKIIRSSVIEVGDNLFFAITDEQNRGQLYALSLKELKLYTDEKFERKFLLSQSGIFLLNNKEEKIVTVDRLSVATDNTQINTNLYWFSLTDSLFFEYKRKEIVKGDYYHSDSLISSKMMIW